MTTELPSGESSTEEKLTELKNSSRVSFGLPSAKARRAQLITTATTTAVLLIRIRVSERNKVYTTADSGEASCERRSSQNGCNIGGQNVQGRVLCRGRIFSLTPQAYCTGSAFLKASSKLWP